MDDEQPQQPLSRQGSRWKLQVNPVNEFLKANFEIPSKNPSREARLRWRKAVKMVKNRRRRLGRLRDIDTYDPADENQRREMMAIIRKRFHVAITVHEAADRFIAGLKHYKLSDEHIKAGFSISPDELAEIPSNHEDIRRFNMHGGVDGISKKIKASLQEGIKESELASRQQLYGTNKYAEKPTRNFLMYVWDVLHDLTLIILMVCALTSVVVGLATEGWPKGIYDGLGIILSIFLVVIVTAASDYNQAQQFKALDREKQKVYVLVTRDNKSQKVLIFDLVVGDIVHLSIGDIVPADGLFISGYSLLIDESSLSGESDPSPVSEQKPFLRAGSKVQDGSAKMLVTSVGMRTEWGKLMSILSDDGIEETPLQVKLNGVATIIGQIGLVFAALTFVVLLIRFLVVKIMSVGWSNWVAGDALTILNYFATAVTILVVAVPEGLPLAVTLSLAFAMKKLMDDKALVRHLSACETMGSASCICTDKTGTLTTNHMVVDKLWVNDITESFSSEDTIAELRARIPERVIVLLLQGLFLNTASEVVKAENGKWTVLGTPTETALMEFGLSLGEDRYAEFAAYKKVGVIPFSSVTKEMAVVIQIPHQEIIQLPYEEIQSSHGGLRFFCKGASEIILESCDKIMDCEGNIMPLSEEQKRNVLNRINSLASEALRTLCIAFKDVGNEIYDQQAIFHKDYTLICLFGIKDPVRPGVRDAVQTCIAAGITVRMVTGDNINTAKAIAKECGILTDDGLAIEGEEFRNKNPQELEQLLPKLQVMARSLPLDKYNLVKDLKSMSEVVAVTGDGTNDAPALHESDIGLAMGISGTEVAKESADVIVLDDNFATIVNVARWGRAVYVNIQKFVQFQLTVNIVALIVNFVSACITGSAPLTAVQLLWVNMIMDTLGALALATDPPHDEMMKRPPVRRDDNFITKTMWRNIIGQSVYQLIVLGVLVFAGKKLLNINGPNADITVNTLIFNSFVFCQVFNEINSREMEKINVFEGFFGNWIFIGIITGTVIFQALIIEYLGSFAHTTPLSWQLWLISVIIGFISMIIAVILKCIPVEPNNISPNHHGYQPIPNGPPGVE